MSEVCPLLEVILYSVYMQKILLDCPLSLSFLKLQVSFVERFVLFWRLFCIDELDCPNLFSLSFLNCKSRVLPSETDQSTVLEYHIKGF